MCVGGVPDAIKKSSRSPELAIRVPDHTHTLYVGHGLRVIPTRDPDRRLGVEPSVLCMSQAARSGWQEAKGYVHTQVYK